MDSQSYFNAVQATANQQLGGKELKFPFNGISDTIDSSRYGSPYSVSAVNVMFRSPHNNDFCGGTRPGLKSFSGDQPVMDKKMKWLWPNGDEILWSRGEQSEENMVFSDFGSKITMPDGSYVLNQHETFTVNASKGDVPSDLTSVAFYRARAIVAKDTMWYASRTGTVDDFDYGDHYEDVSRPVAGNVALAGKSGETITALAAILDTTLVIATRRSLFRIVGEPTQQASVVSENIGIISSNAWCFDGTRFWFMGAEGLYSMVFGESPVRMSQHLDGNFTEWSSATLIFDVERNGIHIVGTDKGNASTDWFYDIANNAAWKMVYPVTKRPLFGGLAMINGRNRVMFGCQDGVFRYWDEGQDTDDGTNIVSAVAIGPVVHTTGNTENAFLGEIDCELDNEITASAGANISGVVGNTSHDVIKSSKAFVTWIEQGASGTSNYEKFRYVQVPGWNKVARPRIRCNAVSIVVWSSQNRWAFSKITIVHRGCGRIRK